MSRGLKLELWTGILVHELLGAVLGHCKKVGSAPTRQETRALFQPILEVRKQEALSQHFEDEPSDAQAFILDEQLALAEGLAWGWVRACLDDFLARFQVVHTEQEMPLDLEPTNIRLMTRPDMVLMEKATGNLLVGDFKTLGNKEVTERTIQSYVFNPQMQSGCRAAGRYTGEPVDGYLVFFLLKGSRGKFTNRGAESATQRQYSHLLYANITPEDPPVREFEFTLKGFWLEKQQVWTSELPGEGSSMERWVHLLPLETLYEMFAEVGPYPANSSTIDQFLRTLEGEELRWQKIVAQAANLSQKELEELVPMSYDCDRCGYQKLCFLGAKPDGEGFMPREPHHEEELLRRVA